MIRCIKLLLSLLALSATALCMERDDEPAAKKQKKSEYQCTLEIPDKEPAFTAVINLIESSLLKKSLKFLKSDSQSTRDYINAHNIKELYTPALEDEQKKLLLELSQHFNNDFYQEEPFLNQQLGKYNISELIAIANASECLEIRKLRNRTIERLARYIKSPHLFTDAKVNDSYIGFLLKLYQPLRNDLVTQSMPFSCKLFTAGETNKAYDHFSFSPGNNFFATSSNIENDKGQLTIWDLPNNKKIIDYYTESPITALTFNPKAGKTTLIIGTKYGELIKYNAKTGSTKIIPGPNPHPVTDVHAITQLAFNGKELIAGTFVGRFIIDVPSWSIISKELTPLEDVTSYRNNETVLSEVIDSANRHYSIVFEVDSENDDETNDGFILFDNINNKSEKFKTQHRFEGKFSSDNKYLAVETVKKSIQQNTRRFEIYRIKYDNLNEVLGIALLKQAITHKEALPDRPLIKSLFESFTPAEKQGISNEFGITIN